jgi:hypothetical protein
MIITTPSDSLFHRQLIQHCMKPYPLFSLLTIENFCGTIKVTCILLPAVPCLCYFGYFKSHYNRLFKQRLTHAACNTKYKSYYHYRLRQSVVVTCQVLAKPPGCETVPTYENLQKPAWRGCLCWWHNIQITQDKFMESIHIQNLWSAELSVLELVSKTRLSKFLD